MPPYHIIDASALMALSGCCRSDQFPELLTSLSELVEDSFLRFPKAVVDELKIYARNEQITAWAIGLSKELRPYSADVLDKIAVMQMIQRDFGYESGLEDMDGGEPAIIDLAAAGFFFEEMHLPFWVISEDRGTAPLRPTMEQICSFRNWAMISASDGIKSLGLDHYLIQ